jgi:hypothetical protein
VRQLTAGEWVVDALVAVDERRRLAYFTGTRETPLESHLYAVSLEGGDVRRITSEPGMHAVTLDHACRRFVDVRSATGTAIGCRSVPSSSARRVATARRSTARSTVRRRHLGRGRIRRSSTSTAGRTRSSSPTAGAG